ncbi:hypothetical protein [Lentibacillus cibarius]|uniref:Uncharacterized protein n=1 Tax=Lentibacillus cibarius TaxID=2583219 RepID=A0A5S3QMH4_9BACI|nr:hypothetical protein [Lentibacillus cibarius]TMN23100.1 hypothetical protein FFL34_14145 [Lentibacillus cibarius]
MDHHHQHIYEECKDHMHAYVLVEVSDGTQVDGIITGLDNEYVYMAVPVGQESVHDNDWRPQGFGGFGYGYGGYPGYGYGGYYGYGNRPRRFRRMVLPLAALVALSTLPWY